MTMTILLVTIVFSFLCAIMNFSRVKTVEDFPQRDQNRTISEDSACTDCNSHIPFSCPHAKNASLSIHACTKTLQNSVIGSNNCDTILSFRVENVSLEICISQNQLFLPNASITFVSHKTRKYLVHHDEKEIVPNIKYFFTGSVSVFQLIFPFSGDIYMSKLSGRAILFGESFMLDCNNFKIKDVSNKCYQCRMYCPHPESDEDVFNLKMEKAFSILPRGLQKRNYRKMRSKWKKDLHKITCALHLVSDHLFFKFVGNKNIIKTSNIMIESVNNVNAIFNKNFNFQNGLKELSFVVGQITIYSNDRGHDYKLNGKYMTSNEYLRKFSLYNFNSVCLGVGFTFRNFGTVVGTAFPALPSFNLPGGICEERVKINSHYVSYNTVVISFYSPHKPTEGNLALTLSHELGHSFGAQHDETDECLPGKNVGNFIMSSMVNEGDKPNNYLFSSCSIQNMMPVIRKKKQCLLFLDENRTPICGNAKVEDGEECDCGPSTQCDAIDPCCTPADDKSHKPCSVRRHKGKFCSPKVSLHCSSSCVYMPGENTKICC